MTLKSVLNRFFGPEVPYKLTQLYCCSIKDWVSANTQRNTSLEENKIQLANLRIYIT